MDAAATGRRALDDWNKAINQNIYTTDEDFQHSVSLYFQSRFDEELTAFGDKVVKELEPLVQENHLPQNLPRIDHYDALGCKIDKIVHHPSYEAAGNIIYGSRILERLAKPGGFLEALLFLFLSAQAGEAGHNCPLACSAGIIRVLQKVGPIPNKEHYLKMLTTPSYSGNFTGAQFVTEIQGGSDVGLNETEAFKDEHDGWRIRGEKWFCSNADAELMLVSARFDKSRPGTKGIGLFLVPAQLDSGERNLYAIRRLKDKIGTRTMATAEIEFQEAYGDAVGAPEDGFKLLMENVLHISRLFNTMCVIGMGRRAYHIAKAYAQHRVAFGQPIIQYPLIQEHLKRIEAENAALLASLFATAQLQDDFDTGKIQGDDVKLLLRTLANLNKYLSALWSVEHIHHSLDILAGNGAIESFSPIPRLLRDCIVCENWEGTHHTLRMQLLRDLERYHVGDLFLEHLGTLLGRIPASNPRKAILNQTTERLKLNLKSLKSVPAEAQTLRVKDIADQMVLLYASTHLLIEGIEQEQAGSQSKLLSYDALRCVKNS